MHSRARSPRGGPARSTKRFPLSISANEVSLGIIRGVLAVLRAACACQWSMPPTGAYVGGTLGVWVGVARFVTLRAVQRAEVLERRRQNRLIAVPLRGFICDNPTPLLHPTTPSTPNFKIQNSQARSQWGPPPLARGEGPVGMYGGRVACPPYPELRSGRPLPY
eukprot:scaffold6294_cov54-Phaeocystis_antarctica.AAC.1